MDAYESRYWLADARYWVVVLQIAIAKSPTPDEIKSAHDSAVAVRDSNEDDKYLQPAAYDVVTLAEKVLEDESRKFEDSKGRTRHREAHRSPLRRRGGFAQSHQRPGTVQVLDAVRARDEYNDRIALDRDPQKNGAFVLVPVGGFVLRVRAIRRSAQALHAALRSVLRRERVGLPLLEKLISMSNFEATRTKAASSPRGKSCAFNAETQKAEESIRKPVQQGVAYLDARKLYEEAQKMPDGPDRVKKWREAAAAYKSRSTLPPIAMKRRKQP